MATVKIDKSWLGPTLEEQEIDELAAQRHRLIAVNRELLAALKACLPSVERASWEATPYTGDDPQDRDWESHPLYVRVTGVIALAEKG